MINSALCGTDSRVKNELTLILLVQHICASLLRHLSVLQDVILRLNLIFSFNVQGVCELMKNPHKTIYVHAEDFNYRNAQSISSHLIPNTSMFAIKIFITKLASNFLLEFP